MITETEAYEGIDDLASHASRGMTPRIKIMFGPAGYFYMYLIYGLHHMLNIITHYKGIPSAVLLRSVQGVAGPGRLTRTLDITKKCNTQLVAKKSGLWVEDRGIIVAQSEIVKTPRLGVAYAGSLWSQKLWRYVYVPQGERILKNNF